jgi:hypothetical protein
MDHLLYYGFRISVSQKVTMFPRNLQISAVAFKPTR